ncbi:SdpI family protein [Clostridium sp. PL3]|uniref:SdpI family protein n=1 Tax=Clostridium thailandense TaxID=2794346 RepID=A0A949X4T9_9CLOT|nr:SdpI family protein [Clostridium thailandense]MBV7274533.1 SdpI family protein [Clostridium thailandense]
MLYSLIFGLVTLGFGIIPKIVRPKKINSWYGYRTNLSMKNQDTWEEGNKYSTNQYIIAGVILIALGKIGIALLQNKGYLVPLVAFIPVLYFTVFSTEKHLKKIFDSNGMRINGSIKLKEKRAE